MEILGIDASRANKPQKTGTEIYAWQLIRHLQKIIPPQTEVVLYTREQLEGALAPESPSWKEAVLAWQPKRFWTLGRLSLEMKYNPPDLLWIPTHTIPYCAPKSVVTIHDVGFLSRPDLYSAADKIYHRYSTARIVKEAKHIITVSEFCKREIIKFCALPPERITVTPLAADPCYRPATDSEVSRALALYGIRGPYFIFVGRLEEKKNISGLLKAFAAFREKHQKGQLVLAGRPGYGVRAERISKEYPEARVLGWTRQEDMPALISGALALILPSHYEGFGIPVLEAFASGTPVIASNAASLPEVGGEAALYFDPARPDELASAMGRMYKEPELRLNLRQKGLERAKLFSWEKTAQATWDALRRFL